MIIHTHTHTLVAVFAEESWTCPDFTNTMLYVRPYKFTLNRIILDLIIGFV